MANLRIYELTDTQSSYDKDIYVVVSDSTFTSGDKKMKVGTIYPKIDDLSAAGDFNPSTSTLRLGNGSGSESKVTVTDMLQDSDVVTVIKALGSTGWLNGTKVSSKVDSNGLLLRCASVLGMVTLTGTIRLTSVPATNEVLWTIPSAIPTSTQDIYFTSADDVDREVIEFKIPAGTRNVVSYSGDGDTNTLQLFCVTYPAI